MRNYGGWKPITKEPKAERPIVTVAIIFFAAIGAFALVTGIAATLGWIDPIIK